ncbi:protein STRUBBELIG-RECEPTOR FAMILY 8-like [Humulus lupulus]|uniref:protein STRUBBELIG-RECEPTOR FAMILY 8-like n=1 Tax=Humulus lupulus TaxID=3486 RepID=UPI002B408574|nr:protein STRUBBELIG-RECEPTOR FAMILY 8-like [Humulus lupulus]
MVRSPLAFLVSTPPISGSPPLSFGSRSLAKTNHSGSLPYSISFMPSLKYYLNVSRNSLSQSIGDIFSNGLLFHMINRCLICLFIYVWFSCVV